MKEKSHLENLEKDKKLLVDNFPATKIQHFFLFIYWGYPGQLARTLTNSHGS
jgi:hypothetical protein